MAFELFYILKHFIYIRQILVASNATDFILIMHYKVIGRFLHYPRFF